MSRLDEIKARFEDASAGPWTVDNFYFEIYDANGEQLNDSEPGFAILEDALFAAHARDDVPWLVAKVEKLREMLDCHTRDDSNGGCLDCWRPRGAGHEPGCEIGEVLND